MRCPPYYGSKSCNRPLGQWIISMLPWRYESTYCEPFAGMLGVLLGRQPVASEIVNDLDSNLVNWWRCVRDSRDELAREIALTPFSREVLLEMSEIVQNPPPDCTPVRRALALHVVLEQGLFKRMLGKPSWRLKVKCVGGPGPRNWTGDEIYPLAMRLRNVQIEHRDALDIIERVGVEPTSIIYCDPPYHSAETSPYRHREINIDRMADILRNVKAKVAISGYGTEWDMLGWNRYEKKATATVVNGREVFVGDRIEVLWMNYEPPNQQSKLEL